MRRFSKGAFQRTTAAEEETALSYSSGSAPPAGARRYLTASAAVRKKQLYALFSDVVRGAPAHSVVSRSAHSRDGIMKVGKKDQWHDLLPAVNVKNY